MGCSYIIDVMEIAELKPPARSAGKRRVKQF
jgi:hypothetical protein